MRFPLLALAAGVVLSGQAFAADLDTTFDVTARVNKSCQVSATDIAFGDYDPIATTDLTAQGSVTVKCTKGTSGAVALDLGQNGSGTCAAPVREMASGGERLAYGIYQDAALNTVWGCEGASQSVTASVGPSAPVVLTTYGVVPAGQDAAMGDYIDTVKVTLTF